MSATKRNDVPVTRDESAAILQSAISYCREAGLEVSIATAKTPAGKVGLVVLILGLVGNADNGTLEIKAEAENAVTGTPEIAENADNGTPEIKAEAENAEN